MTELGGLGTTFPAYGPYKHGSIGLRLPYIAREFDQRAAEPLLDLAHLWFWLRLSSDRTQAKR